MAFTLNTFQFNRGTTTANANGSGVGVVIHTYKTSDSNTTVNTSGYFPPFIDGSIDKIFVDDLLNICTSDSTTMVRITSLDPFAYGADLYSNAGAPLVMGAPIAASDGNAAKITGTTLQIEYASATQPGSLSTGSQTIAGAKTFSGLILPTAGIRFPTNTALLDFYESTTFSSTFTIGATTSASATFLLTRIGKQVSISFSGSIVTAGQATPGAKFTSDTLIPADFRPTTSGDFLGLAQVANNSVFKEGVATIDSSGALIIYNDYDETTNFTGSVPNGFFGVSITFTRG